MNAVALELKESATRVLFNILLDELGAEKMWDEPEMARCRALFEKKSKAYVRRGILTAKEVEDIDYNFYSPN